MLGVIVHSCNASTLGSGSREIRCSKPVPATLQVQDLPGLHDTLSQTGLKSHQNKHTPENLDDGVIRKTSLLFHLREERKVSPGDSPPGPSSVAWVPPLYGEPLCF